MNGKVDYYCVLGVAPDAPDFVIKAAYRALAQQYHPDRLSGDATQANSRMAAINDAYRVLGNAQSRTEYDRSRASAGREQYAGDSEEDDAAPAFEAALHEVEERWQVACSIYPDLIDHRARLSRISSSLAFSYVLIVLENRDYQHRAGIAQKMESDFLCRYFGNNAEVLDYAQFLILHKLKAAARALNRLVDVMGSNVDPDLLIGKIDKDFDIPRFKREAARELREAKEREKKAADARRQEQERALLEAEIEKSKATRAREQEDKQARLQVEEQIRQSMANKLKAEFCATNLPADAFHKAWGLAQYMEWKPVEKISLFKTSIQIMPLDGKMRKFSSRDEFTSWVRDYVMRQPA